MPRSARSADEIRQLIIAEELLREYRGV